MDIVDLVAQLNALLLSLHLPFTLESPTDLTPSLLLAILESLLGVRLSLDQEDTLLPTSPEAKRTRHIQIIKVFLGVLETDVFKADVGLSGIDPRLLASGAWDEVVFVAEILCWIGREVGLVPSPRRSLNKGKARELVGIGSESENENEWHCEEPEPASPTSQPNSPSSTITFLPPFSSPLLTPDPTTTSLLFTESTSTLNDNDNDHTIHTLITSPRATSSPAVLPSTLPRSGPSSSRIPPSSLHPRPGTSTSTTSTPSSSSRKQDPVRRTGYISLVDHDAEISSFLSHSLNLSSTSLSPPPPPSPSPPPRKSPPPPPLLPPPLPPHTPASRHHKPTTPRAHAGPTTPNNHARQDWLAFIAENPDYDPRRTLLLLQQRTRLMEKLLQLRMSAKPAAK